MTDSLAARIVGQRVLITTSNWFFAPNGRQYRAVVGRLRGIHSAPAILGIKVNARSVDWYAEVGRMVVAGCEINHAIAVEDHEPNLDRATDFSIGQNAELKEYERLSSIFDAGD